MIISKRMGWACSSNEREEKDTQNFGRTTWRRKAKKKDVDESGSIILKRSLKRRMWG
jgi:hypothetical protein